MASVSSLDQDMRHLRLARYTLDAAREVRAWIEATLGDPLPDGDLLDALRDGVALCRLANLVLPAPGVKFQRSAMPFIQMENVSHFLKACEMPPLLIPAHDRFLTVDLYEAKDPAQVLQCLGAFSRQAHAARPDVFRTTIGPRKAAGTMSPTVTGGDAAVDGVGGRWRPPSPTKPSMAQRTSPTRTGDSPTRSTGSVSSWSKKTDEGSTAPAWNIHQYGYMGGASQGNQGISFGARRQITSAAPAVPSLAEKERIRKEKAEETERLRQQAEEAEHRRRVEREAEESQSKLEEERRWEEETRRLREEERRRLEEQKRQWDEEERKWKQDEATRRSANADLQAMQAPGRGGRQKQPPEKPRVPSSGILRGQTLSQYNQERQAATSSAEEPNETPEQARVRELEKQLAEARERERQYQAERAERLRQEEESGRSSRASESRWTGDEREAERQRRPQSARKNSPPAQPTVARVADTTRPLPEPQPAATTTKPTPASLPWSTRPLPQEPKPVAVENDDDEQEPPPSPRRSQATTLPPPPTTTNPEPAPASAPAPRASQSSPFRARPPTFKSSPSPFSAAGPSSLLEREMERERQRQREWEAHQVGLSGDGQLGGGTGAEGKGGVSGGGDWGAREKRSIGGPREMGAGRR